MPTFGPIYCETLLYVAGMYPAEPVNTVSNGAIVLFGVLALFLVARRTPRSYDLYLLCILLIVNGLGSFLWHATRTRWALALDIWPALIFLLLMVYFWARRVSPAWHALLLLAGFYATVQLLRYSDLIPFGRWASIAPAVILMGIWLVWRTVPHSPHAALLGAASLGTALVALTFRTIDHAACAYVPFGTHFLWHIFLSCAAFLGVMALITLTRAGTAKRSAPTATPAESPAE